jgi:hypothetical protein
MQGGNRAPRRSARRRPRGVDWRLSSERARQAVRQKCRFSKKQSLPLPLLVVVCSGRVADRDSGARTRPRGSARSAALCPRRCRGRGPYARPCFWRAAGLPSCASPRRPDRH